MLSTTSVTGSAPPRSGIRARLLTRVADLPPAAWNGLVVPGDRLAEHAFVRMCQESRIEDSDFRFLAVEEGLRLIGAAAFFRMNVSLDLLADRGFQALVNGLRRRWPGFLRVPVAFCGLPVSFGTSMIRWENPEAARRVVDAAEETLVGLAGEWRTPLLCLKETGDAEAVHLDALRERGWLKLPSLPACRLDNRWSSVPDYVGAMRTGYRRQWRATTEQARRAGISVTEVTGDADPDRFHGLYVKVMSHAAHRLEILPRTFFVRLFANSPPGLRVWQARIGDSVAGMAVVMTAPSRWIFLLIGMEEPRRPGAPVYGALVQRIVAEAIEAGVPSLELGQTSYEMKSRLGGVTSPRWIYLNARSESVRKLLAISASQLFPDTSIPPRRVFRAED